MKNIKDYLHLYLGCSYQWKDDDGEWRRPELLTAYQLNSIRQSGREVKLILRKLSDMTEEEMDEVWYGHETKTVLVLDYKNSGITRKVALCSERTRYLLSKGFDIFDLIPAGLAIDSTTLKEKV